MPIGLSLSSNACRIHCPAKLNLTLAVGALRANGMHPIASVMVAVDFSDTLLLWRIDDGPSVFKRGWGDDAPRPHAIDWPIESDLMYRAHALLEDEFGQSLPVTCELMKRIPAGAGLGGGSSNAAGMLVGLREIFALDIEDVRLAEFGMRLGADVAFAVHVLLGRSAALVTGVGEVVEPLGCLPGFDAVLVLPDGGCATGEVYAAFDSQAVAPRSPHSLAEIAGGWRAGIDLPDPINDLFDAACSVSPAVRDVTDRLRGMGYAARLTGSGAALYVIANDSRDAQAMAHRLNQAGLIAVPTRYPAG